jgi:hypothetical protein
VKDENVIRKDNPPNFFESYYFCLNNSIQKHELLMLVNHKHFIIEYFNKKTCQMKGGKIFELGKKNFHFSPLVMEHDTLLPFKNYTYITCVHQM